MQTNNHNLDWLMENGSPAIRMRTWMEILGKNPTQEMIEDLLEYSMTQQWMVRLEPEPHFLNLHGSKPTCLENIGGKLRELGFDVKMSPDFSTKLKPYEEFLSGIGKENAMSEFSTLFTYAPLVTIGFDHLLFLDMAVDHLNHVGDFCRKMDFDIYIDPNTFGGMYSQYKGRKLLNPETNHRLPTIWIIYMLAYMPRFHRREEIEQAESAILNYVMTDKYQQFPDGYGIMYHPPTQKYYSHGWEVYLPAWFGFNLERGYHEGSFLQRLELFSNFKQAQPRKWFQNSVAYFEGFKTNDGTYRFPAKFLKEGTSGYYVTGSYLRLEENRRRKIALELDSTFRMELIKKRISQ